MSPGADFIVEHRESCYWQCEKCRKHGKRFSVLEAAKVAALADEHNARFHKLESWTNHDINWANASYAMRHHEPERWDMSAFRDEQSRSRSRWQ